MLNICFVVVEESILEYQLNSLSRAGNMESMSAAKCCWQNIQDVPPKKTWFQNFCWQDIDIELESTSRKCSIGHQMEFSELENVTDMTDISV